MKAEQVKKNRAGPHGRGRGGPPDPTKVLDVAMRMLARRALSVAEVHERLAARGFEEDACDRATARLADFGYLNDQNLAVNIVQQAKREGRGPLWVRRTLHRRRISLTVLQRNHVDDDLVHDAPAMEAAAHLVRRRFTDLHDIKVKQRAVRFLCNRGFPPPVAFGIIGDVAAATSTER